MVKSGSQSAREGELYDVFLLISRPRCTDNRHCHYSEAARQVRERGHMHSLFPVLRAERINLDYRSSLLESVPVAVFSRNISASPSSIPLSAIYLP